MSAATLLGPNLVFLHSPLPFQYFNPEEFKFDDPPAPKDPDYDIEYDF